MRVSPRKCRPMMMMTIPATMASSADHARINPPMIEALAPSATNTVEKPSTNISAPSITAVVFDVPAVAAIDVRGGGPGIRDGAVLDLANTVERIDAIALSGGSAFGLEAGGGVQAWLAERGRGFVVRGAVIPIVPGAIMFDLLNGGNKNWGRFPPYRDLGYAAAEAAGPTFAL